MKLFNLTAVVGIALLLVACANQPRVVTDYDAAYNFAGIKTFSVRDARQDAKDNVLISPFTFSHVKSSIERELSQRYGLADQSTSDILVSFHIVIEEKLDPGSYDRMYGWGYYGRGYRYGYGPSPLFLGSTGSVRVYNQGSLIIDLVDAKTKKPIWRGVSEKRLRSGLTPQEQREILSRAVNEILVNFPPL